MILVLILLTCAAFMALWWHLTKQTSHRFLPPQVPISVSADIPAQNVHMTVMQKGKRMGGIYRDTEMSQIVIVVTSFELMTDALRKGGLTFAGRPNWLKRFGLSKNSHLGITAAGIDHVARQTRAFTLSTLRDLGLSTSQVENIILREIKDVLFTELDAKVASQGLANVRPPLSHTAANIISTVLFGKRYSRSDSALQLLCKSLPETILKLGAVVFEEQSKPWRRWFPSTSKQQCEKTMNDARLFFNRIIDEHQLGSSRNDCSEDFVDKWLGHVRDTAKTGSDIQESSLSGVLFDVFLGGFDEISTAVEWILNMMVHHPSMQTAVQREIRQVCPQGDMVSLMDREQLPYTEAVMLETLRMFPVAPFGAPHQTTSAAQIGGYQLPKDTRVGFHIYSVHYDEGLWGDPETFRPERFIREGRVVIPPYFMPFSMGKRSCLGEMLAKKEVFSIYANLLSRYTFSVPDGARLPSLNIHPGFILHPESFDFIVTTAE